MEKIVIIGGAGAGAEITSAVSAERGVIINTVEPEPLIIKEIKNTIILTKEELFTPPETRKERRKRVRTK